MSNDICLFRFYIVNHVHYYKYKYNKLLPKKILIDDDVWIGAGAVILAGIKIEKRVVVGALSVVTKCLESDGVYVGITAHLIKKIDGAKK